MGIIIIIKLFGKEVQQYFPKHKLIHQMFHYLGVILLSYCLQKYEEYVTKRELQKSGMISSNAASLRQHNTIVLIHYKPANYFSLKKSFFTCLIVCISLGSRRKFNNNL